MSNDDKFGFGIGFIVVGCIVGLIAILCYVLSGGEEVTKKIEDVEIPAEIKADAADQLRTVMLSHVDTFITTGSAPEVGYLSRYMRETYDGIVKQLGAQQQIITETKEIVPKGDAWKGWGVGAGVLLFIGASFMFAGSRFYAYIGERMQANTEYRKTLSSTRDKEFQEWKRSVDSIRQKLEDLP